MEDISEGFLVWAIIVVILTILFKMAGINALALIYFIVIELILGWLVVILYCYGE